MDLYQSRDLPSTDISQNNNLHIHHNSNGKVRIIVRIRPLLPNEQANKSLILKDVIPSYTHDSLVPSKPKLITKFEHFNEAKTIKIIRPDFNNIIMKFDEIIDEKGNQNDVFMRVNDAVNYFLQGNNYTIFAYGQTGAGKTYSTIGCYSEATKNTSVILDELKGENRGLLPRILELIHSMLGRQKKLVAKLNISFYEVYNDKIYDLLSSKETWKQTGLELRENRNGAGNHIVDLTTYEIKNVDQAFEYLKIGLRNRNTGCTHGNAQSSRSHSIFQIELIQLDNSNKSSSCGIIASKLRIVDLAGSEKYIISNNITPEEKELRIQELTSINGSLSTLGHCISALIEPKRTHIPFRNSKLTRVLSDSLGGNGKVCFIVCISPSAESETETFSTLQFANRAKKVVLDGRYLKKDKGQEGNNLAIEKVGNLFDIIRNLSKDSKFENEFSCSSSIFSHEKFVELKDEVQNLKKENIQLKKEIHEIKRSCSPFSRSPISNSNSILCGVVNHCSQNSLTNIKHLKNITQNEKYGLREEDHNDENENNNNYSEENSLQDTSARTFTTTRTESQLTIIPKNKQRSISPLDKRVRFREDCMTEKMKHELEYQDNTIFKNLSIFKDVDFKKNKNQVKKKLSSPPLKTTINIQSDDLEEEEIEEERTFDKNKHKKFEDNYTSFGKTSLPTIDNNIKKQIEAKYQIFFSKGDENTNNFNETLSNNHQFKGNKGHNNNATQIKDSKREAITNQGKIKGIMKGCKNEIEKNENEEEKSEAIIFYNIAKQFEDSSIQDDENDNIVNQTESSSLIGDYHLGKPYYVENYNELSQLRKNIGSSNEVSIISPAIDSKIDKRVIGDNNSMEIENHSSSSLAGGGGSGLGIGQENGIKSGDERHRSNSIKEQNPGSLMDTIQLSFSKDKSIDLSKILNSLNLYDGATTKPNIIDESVLSMKEHFSFKGEELIRSIDRRLGKVHEMNVQHGCLLENLDEKLAKFQQKSSSTGLHYYDLDSNSNTNTNSNGIEDMHNENNGNNVVEEEEPSLIDSPQEFVNIVARLKGEISDALNHVKYLQKDDQLNHSTLLSKTEIKTNNADPKDSHLAKENIQIPKINSRNYAMQAISTTTTKDEHTINMKDPLKLKENNSMIGNSDISTTVASKTYKKKEDLPIKSSLDIMKQYLAVLPNNIKK